MRRAIIIIVLIVIGFSANAQLHSLSDQYLINGLAINPAFSGSDDALSTTVMYRNQWTGFEGAPTTITAAIHSPLRNERVALGLLVLNDNIGVNNETSLMANYAYLIEMGDGKLSFGVGVGVSFINVGWDQLDAIDIEDLELFADRVNVTNPNFSAGIYYYNRDFFLGFSLPFFLSYAYDDEELELKNDMSEYNMYLTSGYTFELNQNLKFLPSGLLKYHPGDAFQLDVSGQFIIHDRLWLGAMYRTVDAVAAIMQIQVTDQIRFAYTYDTGLKKTSRYYGGSHEVSLKFVFNHNSRVVGPKRF